MSSPTFIKTDAGRSTSKRPKQKNDCTVRTLAKLLVFTYDQTYDFLHKAGRECNRGWDIEGWARKNTVYDGFNDHQYFQLHKMPWTKDHHEVGQARRYRLSDFLADHPSGYFAVSTAKHVFAVMNGFVFDDSPWHFLEDRPVYSWLEMHHVRLPLWQVYALRRPIKKGSKRMVKRTVGLVEGATYKLAMRVASKQYEWALRTNEDLTVEEYRHAVAS